MKRRPKYSDRVRCCCALLIATSALVGAARAGAQSAPRQSWTAEVTTGLLIQPVSGGGAGKAFSITLGRTPQRAMWTPSVLVAAARVGDIGSPSTTFNGYIVDRDWVITAIGADALVARTERFTLSLGAKGGVLWNYDRPTEVAATHPLGLYGPTNWEMKAGLIIDASAQYRVGQHVSLASRVGGVTHMFTDNMIGSTGLLASLGFAFGW